MDAQIYVLIVCISFFIAAFIKFAGWKLWKHIFHPDSTGNKNAFKIVIIFDPLISCITFPMASDLYLSLEWATSCNLIFVCITIILLLLLYCSALILSYNLILTIPVMQNGSSKYKHLILIYYGCSVLINLLLTWIVLLCTVGFSNISNAAEECWPSFLYKDVYFIFEITFTFQIAINYLYLQIFICVLRNYKNYISIAESNVGEKNPSQSSVLICCAVSIICLFIANVFRSLFSFCSCYSYSHLSSGVLKCNGLFLTKTAIIGIAWLCRCVYKRLC